MWIIPTVMCILYAGIIVAAMWMEKFGETIRPATREKEKENDEAETVEE